MKRKYLTSPTHSATRFFRRMHAIEDSKFHQGLGIFTNWNARIIRVSLPSLRGGYYLRFTQLPSEASRHWSSRYTYESAT